MYVATSQEQLSCYKTQTNMPAMLNILLLISETGNIGEVEFPFYPSLCVQLANQLLCKLQNSDPCIFSVAVSISHQTSEIMNNPRVSNFYQAH